MTHQQLAARSELGAWMIAIGLVTLAIVLVTPGTQIAASLLGGFLFGRGCYMVRRPPRGSRWWLL